MNIVTLFLLLTALIPDWSAKAVTLDVKANLQRQWDLEYNGLLSELADTAYFGKPSLYWQLLDTNAFIFSQDKTPLRVVLRRTRALIADIEGMDYSPDLSAWKHTLDSIETQAAMPNANSRELFNTACRLRRKVALSNPLLTFDSMVYYCSGGEGGLIQDWGKYINLSGLDIYMVTGIKTDAANVRNLLENAVVQNGPLCGKKLTDYSNRGVSGLDIDKDGETLTFGWQQERKGTTEYVTMPQCTSAFNSTSCIQIFKMRLDGSGLMQLTDIRRDNYHPIFLPSGRIAFISNRFGFLARCQGAGGLTGQFQVCGQLFSMKSDGSDVIPLSWHETSEIFPSVDNTGMIVYTRWDYIDRDWSAAHNLWRCYPDGKDPRAPHGNYPYPWGPEGTYSNGSRAERPWAESGIQAVPNTFGKYVAIAANHHANADGSLVTIDITVPDDNKMSQVKRYHPVAFLEEECLDDPCGAVNIGFLTPRGSKTSPVWYNPWNYMDPWPIGNDYVIVCNGENVFLLDKFGNQEWLFGRPGDEGICRFPRPVKEWEKPELSISTFQGERYNHPDHKAATICVQNIYETDIPFPPGTKIKELRVFQLIARPWEHPWKTFPGYVNGRMLVGTVPVEEDGSAYFLAPVEKSLYFQAVDENGCAVQSMRSAAYVHPGEQLTCIGCHEDKWKTYSFNPMAMKRPPSPLVPNLADGSCPITRTRLVGPVLAKHPWLNLREWHLDGGTGGGAGAQEGYRSIPGKVGARYVGMDVEVQRKVNGDSLTDDEKRRILLWVDALSMTYTANFDFEKQDRGEVVWPNHEVDPNNPAGTEDNYGFPVPNSNVRFISIRAIAEKSPVEQFDSTRISTVNSYSSGFVDTNSTGCVFTSLNPSLAEVSPMGIMRTKGFGMAQIKVSRGPFSDTIEIPITNTAPPVLKQIISIGDPTRILLVFNERLDKFSAETAANYRLDHAISVVSAVLASDTSVILSISSSFFDSVTYTVFLGGIKDVSGNAIPANTQMAFTFKHAAGRISITCDDSYQLYVNDSLIGSGNVWHEMNSYNLLFRLTNTIAVRCDGGGDYTGLLAEIAINERQPFGSSSGWKASSSAPANWTSPDFNDAGWSNAADLGAYGIDPWVTGVNGINYGTPAHWIWFSPADGSRIIYFRYTFKILDMNTGYESVVSEKESGFQLFPNPFNPAVRILLPGFQGQGLLRIYDVSGRFVREFLVGQKERRLVWDGKDANRVSVGTGMYIITFTGRQGETMRKKVMLMR